MTSIKFGTDGWRAIIAQEYTVENVKRVAEATARWMLNKKMSSAVIGYDCRFGGQLFMETVSRVFGNFGIKTILSDSFVSTPVVSYTTAKLGADMGIVITASHNPPAYNGYKLKSSYGGPSSPKDIEEVELLIPEKSIGILPNIQQLKETGLIEYMDMDALYLEHVRENFDLDTIQKMSGSIAYDAMYGAGQKVMKTLLPDATLLHCEYNPSFNGQAPEPIEKNLKQLSNLLASTPHLKLGIANDGDADRIGMYDEHGVFIDSHHILLLLLYYMVEYKNVSGKVIVTFSVTDKMKKLAEYYGRECEVTKIGFKYIAEKMVNEDVVVGGEESGGLAVKGHIPERDGIWIALLILEFMAKTGKTINQLIQDVYDKVGSFAFARNDLQLSNDEKNAIIELCKNEKISALGDRAVMRKENIDGYKYYVSEDEWILIRPSGTEPVLRVYSQAPDRAKAEELLKKTLDMLLSQKFTSNA